MQSQCVFVFYLDLVLTTLAERAQVTHVIRLTFLSTPKLSSPKVSCHHCANISLFQSKPAYAWRSFMLETRTCSWFDSRKSFIFSFANDKNVYWLFYTNREIFIMYGGWRGLYLEQHKCTRPSIKNGDAWPSLQWFVWASWPSVSCSPPPRWLPATSSMLQSSKCGVKRKWANGLSMPWPCWIWCHPTRSGSCLVGWTTGHNKPSCRPAICFYRPIAKEWWRSLPNCLGKCSVSCRKLVDPSPLRF